jgi:hypothetical protein
LTVCAASAAVIVALPGTGWAHYVYNQGVVATWNSFCNELRVETSHGSGYGYSKVDVKSISDNFYISGFECTDPFVRPTGYFRAAYSIYKYNGSTWALCVYTPNWTYNSSSTGKLVISNTWPSVYCGTGSYYTMGEGDILDDSIWHGGDLNSGNHYLPPI